MWSLGFCLVTLYTKKLASFVMPDIIQGSLSEIVTPSGVLAESLLKLPGGPRVSKRGPVRRHLPSGLAAMEALLPMAEGQRLGLVGPPGTGKSTALRSLFRSLFFFSIFFWGVRFRNFCWYLESFRNIHLYKCNIHMYSGGQILRTCFGKISQISYVWGLHT